MLFSIVGLSSYRNASQGDLEGGVVHYRKESQLLYISQHNPYL